MQDIGNLKLDVISRVLQLTDRFKLEQLFEYLSEKSDPVAPPPVAEPRKNIPGIGDPFVTRAAVIRSGVTKEQIFAEQNKKPLLREEYEELVGGMEWNHSSEELIAML